MTPRPLAIQACEAHWALLATEAVHGSCCRMLVEVLTMEGHQIMLYERKTVWQIKDWSAE